MLRTPEFGCSAFCPPPVTLKPGEISHGISIVQRCNGLDFWNVPVALSPPPRLSAVQVPGLNDDPPDGTPAVYTVVNTDSSGRCGPEHNHTRCPHGECCSVAGYCGQTPEHCRVPQSCQRKYGKCDSDEVPEALKLRPGLRYQARMWYGGPVPYGRILDRCTVNDTVALTFDDGPSNNTVAIMDLLRQHKAKATFFVSGNTNARGAIDQHAKWINLIRRMHHEGHQVGSHTWSHPHMDSMSDEEQFREMLYNDIAIYSITQASPTYMRPPYVECSTACMNVMHYLGYHVIGYEIDTRDTEDLSLEQMKSIVDNALAKKAPGDSAQFILHDHSENVIPLTQYILKKTSNLKAVTMAECLGDDKDKVYLQCPPDPLVAIAIGVYTPIFVIFAALLAYWIFLCVQKDKDEDDDEDQEKDEDD